MNNLYTAPVSELKNLNNLFIELTEKNCNQRCKHCYIDFPLNKNIKDFISVDVIKKALSETMKDDLQCIYLVGAEPMTHPDFNSILRLCLKRSNVCIFTNGSFINEKKARFLKKIEDESDYEIIFQLSIDHFNEIKNDDIRGRGSYRQVLNALKSLVRYDFNPVLCITNYYKESYDVLIDNFMQICKNIGFKADVRNFKINLCHDKSADFPADISWDFLDCEYGRILTSRGVYSCPFLSNDHRGRSGCDFTDYSKKCSLETTFCASCIRNKSGFFGIDYKLFLSV